MRILLVHNRYRETGGEDRVVDQERNLLLDNGNEVELFSVSNDEIVGFHGRLQAGLRVSYSNNARMRLDDVLRKVNPDLMHAHNIFPILTPSIYDACMDVRVPVVQTLHNYRIVCANALFMRKGRICEDCLQRTPYHAVIHRCYRKSIIGSLAVAHMIAVHSRRRTWLNKVSRFIALSEFSKMKFVQAGLPEERIIVKPNFIDSVPVVPNHQIRKGALFVGRLSEEKGITPLLEAWDARIGQNLTVIGDGPMSTDLERSKDSSITWMGLQQRKVVFDKLYSTLFLILPSQCYENFPVSIIEAYACGVPVITSGMGALAEIVTDGETGLHFMPGNAADLRKKIMWAFDHPYEMQQMGLNAAQRFKERYTAMANYHQLIQVYDDALKDYQDFSRGFTIRS